jgi:hypothetical protein
MKAITRKIKSAADKILIGAFAVGVAILGTLPAMANAYLQNLNVTNILNGTNVISGYPTNQFNPTNGVPMNNGKSARIQDFREWGLNVQGFLLNTSAVASATSLSFMLVGSMDSGVPTVTLGTNAYSGNGTVIIQNDFVSTNLLIGPILVPIPFAQTNWFNWSTNFSGFSTPSWLAQASWVGIYTISNNFPTGCMLSNAVITVGGKYIPTPLIGN